MIITLDGISGAGKSTQCKILSKSLSVPVFSGCRSFFESSLWLFNDVQSEFARSASVLIEIVDALAEYSSEQDTFIIYDFFEPFFYVRKDYLSFLYSFFVSMIKLRELGPFVNFFLDVSEVGLRERLIRRLGNTYPFAFHGDVELKFVDDFYVNVKVEDALDFLFENEQNLYNIDGNASVDSVFLEIKEVLLSKGVSF